MVLQAVFVPPVVTVQLDLPGLQTAPLGHTQTPLDQRQLMTA